MSALESLLNTAADEKQSSYKRRQAIGELLTGHIQERKIYPLLENLLQSNDAYFVREIVGVLKKANAPEVLPLLRQALGNDDDYTKRDVIQALGQMGEEQDLIEMKAFLESSSYSVSHAAKQAVEALNKRLLTETTKESEPESEPEPEEVVAEIAEESISESEPLATESEPEVQEEAVQESVEPEVAAEIDNDLLNENRDSLHDNSIYKEADFKEVHQNFEARSAVSVSDIAPALKSTEHVYESKNLKAFFGDQYQTAQALYKQLKETQKQLPLREHKLSEVRRQLMMLEADKADDLELSSESTEEQSKKTADLKW